MKLQQYLKYCFKTRTGATELLVALAWAYPLLYYVKAIVLRLPNGELFAGAVLPLIFMVLVLMSYGHLRKSFRAADFFFAMGLGLLFLIHLVSYPENKEIILRYFPSLFAPLITMYYIGLAIDIDEVYKPFYILSIICVLLQALNTLYFEAGERIASGEEMTEQMNTAYRILPYVLFCSWSWLRKFNLIGFLTSIIGLFLLISYGARGPVSCTFLFIILYVFFFKAFNGKWFIVILLGIITIILYSYLGQFLMVMQALLSRMGLATRIIDMSINEIVTVHASGRDYMAEMLINSLKDSPFWGYGIGGTWNIVGTYAHNIVLDFLISFGVLPGSLLLLAILMVFYKGFKACVTIEEKGFFLLLFCCFAKLFVSYVFLGDHSWMLLLGYSVGMVRRKKNQLIVYK